MKFPSGRNLLFKTQTLKEEKIAREWIADLAKTVVNYRGSRRLEVHANIEQGYVSLSPMGRSIDFMHFNLPPENLPRPNTPSYVDVRFDKRQYIIYLTDISGGG